MKIKQLGWVGVFLTVFFVIVGCGSDEGDSSGSKSSNTGTVSGKVISVTTGVTVSDASIRTGTTTVTSAVDGTYTLTADVGERVVIHVESPDFSENVQIVRVQVGQTTSLDLKLLPTGVTPNQFYEGTVSHFSFWNAGQTMDTVFYSGWAFL